MVEFGTPRGRPIPADSRSFDSWFQHIAVVVRDIDQAYQHLRSRKVRQVSTGPQTLPAWNPAAAGIRAFYFQDPEGHVLEIIWFPPGKGDAKWQTASMAANAPLFLGIDHTAIVVSDTDASLAFYTNALGLRVAGGAENHGTEQEHLNQVFGARLRITALRAERGPGIEFLENITPPGGRPLPPDAKATVSSANYSVDYSRGLVTFTADTAGTSYYVTARSFDLEGAAAEIWRNKQSHYAAAVDFSTKVHDISRSQLYEHAKEMAEHYASMGDSGFGSMTVFRSDMDA